MKRRFKSKNFIGDYIIYENITPKMWAIIIMPIEIRTLMPMVIHISIFH